ncbi:hypothetical protein EIP91_012052 [Steccherinum ochraceum]|uniref:Phospholipid/glycerol acyltransferase domain-containing protein n=1 Tax=Steccherinum ochraceum TaxID=92696 RepID=A0A4R0RJK6_9APHY|nr:hypothetical protein EIP91_012052 [Steccherinum ochraceum]
MEKFSSYRDPGTGIQPFLTPLPPAGSDIFATALLPFGYILGVARTALIVVLGLVYAILVGGVCTLLKPVPPLYRIVTHVLTAIIARTVLLLVGLLWIPAEHITRKRVKGAKYVESWNPKAGDVIVTNWVSWIELLWLAYRCNPIFLVPVANPAEATLELPSVPVSRTPGRRTGTGSAAISSPATRAPSRRADILGFQEFSLFGILAHTGQPPLPSTSTARSFEEIRAKADRPVVVFPECTTSNGRGLLRFAEVFKGVEVPVRKYKVFVMCVRYDPPSSLSPSLSNSIPSSVLNPLPHIFKLTTSLTPLSVSIRLLNPVEAPSSGSFLLSEFLTNEPEDTLSEVCAMLIAQIGKMKRVGMGWEDKVAFLDFFRAKK